MVVDNMASQNPLISVIVPIYRVERYLHRCVDSILAQTYTNLEIILVDDGSPDRSGDICDEYAAKDSRIKVVHQNNGGLSAARNAGLDICKGEYITFVDSDDFIEYDMISQLLNGIADADLCRCGMIRHDSHGMVSGTTKPDYEISLSGLEVLRQHYNGENGRKQISAVSAWGQLCKRSLFEDLRFKKGLIFEDIHLMPYLLVQCGHIKYLPYAGYHYMSNAGSITTNVAPAHAKKCYEDCFRIWEDHEMFYHENGWSDLVDAVNCARAEKIITHIQNDSIPRGCEDWSRKLLHRTAGLLLTRPVGVRQKLRYAAFCLLGRRGYALLKRQF
jgi:glycosyltransferase involved in cell wall biosynthesis